MGHLRDAQHGFTIGAAEGMVMTHLPPNHALQRTAAGRRSCNRRASWPPSLSFCR